MEYCVYLTIYKGNLLPPFYIGSSSVKRISKGYKGSVCSQKYKKIWKEERKHNPELFKTLYICAKDNGYNLGSLRTITAKSFKYKNFYWSYSTGAAINE